MPWNPEIYNQFKAIRYQPFFDLADLIRDTDLRKCVDIGCGTGEQTAILSEKFKKNHFLGIDSSEEMLREARKTEGKHLQFEKSTIEEFADSESRWDLIFSNAALQWSDNHETLFPKLIAKLNPGGQFAVQMPLQTENKLNQILFQVVREEPFSDLLQGFVRTSPVLSIDQYAEILFREGLTNLNLTLKVYPLIANDAIELYNFISGSALIPYMEKLNKRGQEILRAEFLDRIREHFPLFPAIYSFKRLLLYGLKTN